MHFINDGVTVDGNHATVEFTGAGEFDTFVCNLDRKRFKPCEEVHLILIVGVTHDTYCCIDRF